MKKEILVLFVIIINVNSFAQWRPVGDKIKTKWAEEIDINNVLPEYPRPIMERSEWKNLNGLWDYAITKAGEAQPSQFDGRILVPFAVESSLSGVQKSVGEENELWYKNTFTIPSSWKSKKILLHFGAVDWETDIWINDIKVGTHKGGYTPFSLNVTPYLNKLGAQKLVVKVWDPIEKGYQPRGKQTSQPKGIFYTSVTGIWQTVWLEPVNEKYIENVHSVSDIDNKNIQIEACVNGITLGDYIEVVVKDNGKIIAKAKAIAGLSIKISIPEPKLWSPASPYLYDMEVKLISNNKEVDEIKSYFAMRKISTKRDQSGIVRLQLNNKDYFQFGPLDQGWWPDGLYTAPSDEALKFDIEKTKELGFNMIRKHMKVEPARWYTHCDRLGILVWQDMPSGDKALQWQNHQYYDGPEIKRSKESEANYCNEWEGIIDLLYSNPSVVCWVPFNEAWGQFKTEEIANWTKDYDPSRVLNPASGGNFFQVGDMLDLHNYPEPKMYLYDGGRANVLGEYGGIGLAIEGHLWDMDRNWGYVKFKESKEATDQYLEYAGQLFQLIKSGFSAAVYTQTTDVESEINGLITYDRKVIKMDLKRIREINSKICNSLN